MVLLTVKQLLLSWYQTLRMRASASPAVMLPPTWIITIIALIIVIIVHSHQPYPQELLAPRRWSCHRHQHQKAWKPDQRCQSLFESRRWIVFTQNCCQYKQETAVQYKLRVVTIEDWDGLVQIQINIKTQILMEGLVFHLLQLLLADVGHCGSVGLWKGQVILIERC